MYIYIFRPYKAHKGSLAMHFERSHLVSYYQQEDEEEDEEHRKEEDME